MKRRDIRTLVTILTACITLTACGASSDETIEVTEASKVEAIEEIETSETIESIIKDTIEEVSESEFSVEVTLESDDEEIPELSTADLEESEVEETSEVVTVEMPVVASESAVAVNTITNETNESSIPSNANNLNIVLRPSEDGYGYQWDYNGKTYYADPGAYVGTDGMLYHAGATDPVLYGTPGAIEARYVSEKEIQDVLNVIPKYFTLANAVLHNVPVNPTPDISSNVDYKLMLEDYNAAYGILNVTTAVGEVEYWAPINIYQSAVPTEAFDGGSVAATGFDVYLIDHVSGMNFVFSGCVYKDGTIVPPAIAYGQWHAD